jgi:ATP-dependent DNA helicase RecG
MNLGNETEFIEFKESLAQLDKGIKSLTSMLNRNGSGSVYFGVDDNGNAIGLMVGKKTLDDVKDRIKDIVAPKVIPIIKVIPVRGNLSIIEVNVRGSDIPYSCDGKYFIRNGRSDEHAPNDLLRRMLSSGSTDLLIQTTSPIEELTFKQMNTLLLANGVHAKETKPFFESKKLLNSEGKFNEMAFILSDQSTVSLKIVTFEGINKASLSSYKVFSDECLIHSLNKVMQYFEVINAVKTDLSKGVRIDLYLFDFKSFREAWINACLHNRWTESLPPAIHIFDNRLEIISYGTLPFDLSLEKFFVGTSKPINHGLMAIFQNAGLVEQSGHGVPIVVENYGKEAYSFESNMVKVTIPFNFEPDFVTARRAKENSVENLSSTQMKVLIFLNDHPESNLSAVAKNNELSLQGVKKVVKVLQEKKLLVRDGSKRDGKWRVTCKLK